MIRLLAPLFCSILAVAQIPAGKGMQTLQFEDTALEVYTYRPAAWSGGRMLMVMHGTLRNADDYRDHAIGMGDRFDALIVAPKFDRERFPSRRYQRGGIQQKGGKAAPAAEWTYAFIPKIAARVREVAERPAAQLYIIGHSAGGQFVVRMTAFLDTGAVRLVAANPGSVLLPSREMPFGYGFGRLPAELAGDDVLRRYLAAPLTIYCGTVDDAPDDYFDRSKSAMLQGAGRHQRGLSLYWTGRTLATERGWDFGWRLVEAPGIEHDHAKMFDHENCALALFGELTAARDR